MVMDSISMDIDSEGVLGLGSFIASMLGGLYTHLSFSFVNCKVGLRWMRIWLTCSA